MDYLEAGKQLKKQGYEVRIALGVIDLFAPIYYLLSEQEAIDLVNATKRFGIIKVANYSAQRGSATTWFNFPTIENIYKEYQKMTQEKEIKELKIHPWLINNPDTNHLVLQNLPPNEMRVNPNAYTYHCYDDLKHFGFAVTCYNPSNLNLIKENMAKCLQQLLPQYHDKYAVVLEQKNTFIYGVTR